MKKIRTTMHNGRAGKHGVFSAKHNSRSFDIGAADHINCANIAQNQYLVFSPDGSYTSHTAINFDEHERDFYTALFGRSLAAQNAKHEAARHYDRIKSVDDYRTALRTCPEEVILQIGDRDAHVSAEKLIGAFAQWYHEMHDRYGSHWHCMDAALHMDEQTPHLHVRFCWSHETPDGRAVSQTKALSALGIERPDTTKPKSQYNCPKMAWTKSQRAIWEDAVRAQGIELENAPAVPGKSTMELEEYVYQKTHAEVQKLSQEREKLQQETAQLAAEHAHLRDEVVMLRAEKSRLQRITDRLKNSVLVLFDRLSKIFCSDGKSALEHVYNDARQLADTLDDFDSGIELS